MQNIQIRKSIKIGDYIIIGFMLCSAIFAWVFSVGSSPGSTAIVYSDGEQVASLSLKQDQQFIASGPLGESIIEVKQGSVYMASSPCPNHICMNMGQISKSNSMVVCVPNHILIEIPGSDSDHLDAITQ